MADPFSTLAARAARGKQLDENGIERNQWGQPVIEGAAYVRATTMAKTLADEYNLTAWKLRMVAKGIATGRDDLYKLASITETYSPLPGIVKFWTDEIIEPALDRAGANAGRKTGTALHTTTHKLDGGVPMTSLPEWTRGPLNAYQVTMDRAKLTIDPAHIEIFTVCTEVGSAGTSDRLLGHATWPKLRVGDLKCQKDHPQEYNAMDIAIQLWIYAEGLNTKGIWRVDDIQTGEGHWDTSTVGRVDTERGVIMWLPHEGPNAGECHLIEIDLVRGRTLARMAERIRAERKAAKTLVRPLTFAAPGATELERMAHGRTAEITMIGDGSPLDHLLVHAQPVADAIDAAFPLAETIAEGIPHVDYAGRQCPDGRVHGAHDGCPGRKRRSPAQIAMDNLIEQQSAAMAQLPPLPDDEMIEAMESEEYDDEIITGYGSDEGGDYDVVADGRKIYRPVTPVENVVDIAVSGVRFRVRFTPDWIESTCEHGDGVMRHEVNEEAPVWRKNHAELKHPHVLLEAAQQPVSGPGIEAATSPRVITDVDMSRIEIGFTDHPLPGMELTVTPVKPAYDESVAGPIFDRLREQRTAEPAAAVDPIIVLRVKIKQMTKREDLSALWRDNSTIWTDELTELGRQVLAGLPG